MKKFLLYALALAMSFGASAAEVTDVLNNANTVKNDKSTTYLDYTYTGTSEAEYSLNCAGSNNSIQLRSDNSKAASGVVVTKSAGTVKSVTLTFVSATVAGRKVSIYGSNTAYTGPADLYEPTATPVTDITYNGTTTSYTYDFTTDYAYIGIRSAGNALYLADISITWDTEGTSGEGGGETPEQPEQPEQPEEPGDTQTATLTATGLGLANAVSVGTQVIDGVTFSFDKGSNSNDPKYYTSGSAIRCYGGNTITISADNAKIVKVEFTFGSDDTPSKAITANVGTFSTPTWTGSSESVEFTIESGSGNRRISAIKVEYISLSDKKAAGLSFAESAVTVNSLDATGFEPTLTYATDGTITYSSSDTDVATVDAATGKVTLVGGGKTTITAASAETATYAAGSASYTLTVVPTMTVAEALDAIKNGFNSTAIVTGIISSITEVSTSYGNATYLIKDALTDEEALTVYRGYWINGDKFTAENQIAVGGTVTVEGELVNFNGTYEFTTGSKVLSYTAPQGGGDEPDQPDQPGDDKEAPTTTFTENFTNTIGLPTTFSAEVQTATSTVTGQAYELMGTYTNSGYIFINGKNAANAYFSFALAFDCAEIVLTTTSGCSTNADSKVNVYAGENLIGTYAVNTQSAEYTVEIPEDCQAAGTVYKIESATTKYNQQFASMTCVEAEASGDDDVLSGTAIMTAQPDMWQGTKDEPVLSEAETYENKVKYENEELTFESFAGYDEPITFKIDVKAQTVTSLPDQLAEVQESDEEDVPTYTYYYGDFKTKTTVLTGTITNTDDGKATMTVEPWGGYIEDMDFFGALYYNTVISLPFSIPNLAGIENVNADNANAPVEYYNLQGVRVLNPESGLYIRRQGTTATKVYIR